MNFNFNKKTVLLLFAIIVFITASFYFGLMISNFKQNAEKKPEIAVNIEKEKTFKLISAAFDDRPAYYSYSAFDEKFYGPYDKKDVKEGDYYAKISAPQGSGVFSSFQYFDKNKKLIEFDDYENCTFGSFYYFDGSFYTENEGQLYKLNPELNLFCSPIQDDEYEKMSVKRILLDGIKDSDTVDVSGYDYFIFDKYITPRCWYGIRPVPEKDERLELEISYDNEDGTERNLNFTIISK